MMTSPFWLGFFGCSAILLIIVLAFVALSIRAYARSYVVLSIRPQDIDSLHAGLDKAT